MLSAISSARMAVFSRVKPAPQVHDAVRKNAKGMGRALQMRRECRTCNHCNLVMTSGCSINRAQQQRLAAGL